MNHLDVDGARLAYQVDGPPDAPPLVLAHALGTSMRMWEPQMPALAARFRVIRYDARGHGASTVSTTPVTIERLGRDMLAVLDHLGVERADLGGLSAGGITGLWVATHEPARVRGLLLANTAARIASVDVWNERIAAVRAGGIRAMRDPAVGRFLTAAYRAAHPDVTRDLGEMVESTPVEGYVALAGALRDADLRADAATVRAPTLIIAGEHDESTPPGLSRDMHESIAGSELVVLDAAHLSNVELADEFTGALCRFFS